MALISFPAHVKVSAMANKAPPDQPDSNESYEEKWRRVRGCRVSKGAIWEEVVWMEWGVEVSWDVIWDTAARG